MVQEAQKGERSTASRRASNASESVVAETRATVRTHQGRRSHSGSRGRTYAQLRNEAGERNIRGRSKMSKEQLERALGR